jgi:two-component system, OmpR family, sensor histidine kinase KdpD
MTRVLTRLSSTLISSAGILAVSVLCARVAHTTATVAAILLMLGVMLSGTYARSSTAIVTSFVAALCLDFFFIPPIGRIAISEPQGWIVLFVFISASLLAANLSSSLRRQRDELAFRQKESEKLNALSRSMLLSDRVDDVPRLIVNKCIELFGATEAKLFLSSENRIYSSQAETSIPDEKLRKTAVYGSLEQDESQRLTILAVNLGNKTLGSLGLKGQLLSSSTLQGLGSTIAVGLAQVEAQEAGTRAEAVRKSEELKSLMIDALAHDLKTPLTAIEAASSMLLEPSSIPSRERTELLEVIEQESKGLKRLLGEAIHLARIDAKKLRLDRQAIPASDLIKAAVASLGERIAPHRVLMDIQEDLPAVFVDRELIVQTIKQLLDNAVKYSPSRSSITIAASTENVGIVAISVRDEGQGLTELEQSRVFEKFYRGRHDRSAVQGTGMGLAIAKEIMEAHGGSIIVNSVLGRGSEFKILLPRAETPQPEPEAKATGSESPNEGETRQFSGRPA